MSGSGMMFGSLSDFAYYEKKGLAQISPDFAVIASLESIAQLRLLYCGLHGVFLGKIICWHPLRARKSDCIQQSVPVELIGNLSEYVFLRDFVFQEKSVHTRNNYTPLLLKPWVVKECLLYENLPAFYQMKLASLNLMASWLHGPQQDDISLLFSEQNRESRSIK